MVNKLTVKNLHVSVGGVEIVKGINLEIKAGEIHALMGPNGSGKSTFANALMGHPNYAITKGKVTLSGKNITALSPNEKARRGLFLSMQRVPEISGVTVSNFLRLAYNSLKRKNLSPLEFHLLLKEKMKALNVHPSFAERHLNHGFSGGEKKRSEILQLTVLEPAFAVLDETDSGLDIDALKTVANAINKTRRSKTPLSGAKAGILLITHYTKILKYLAPDRVHVMRNGEIVKSGGAKLAKEIEKNGYKMFAG